MISAGASPVRVQVERRAGEGKVVADQVGRGIGGEVGEAKRVVDFNRAQDVGDAAEIADVHAVLAALAVDVELAAGGGRFDERCVVAEAGREVGDGRDDRGVSQRAVNGEGVAAGATSNGQAVGAAVGVVDRAGGEAGDLADGAVIEQQGGLADGVCGVVEDEVGRAEGVVDVDAAGESLHPQGSDQAGAQGDRVGTILALDTEGVQRRWRTH